MRFSQYLFIAIVGLATLGGGAVRAEVFVWQDPETKIMLSYPDRWLQLSNQKPDDILTIAGRGENEHASCRLRVNDDRRYKIFPRKYDANVQHIAMSRDFWQAYLQEFDEASLLRVQDDAGMSVGYSSVAEASFVTTAGPKVAKRAFMAASLYNGKAYVLECSAEEQAFAKWLPAFRSVLKSVSIRPIIEAYPTGHYRDFLADAPLKIYGERPVDTYVY